MTTSLPKIDNDRGNDRLAITVAVGIFAALSIWAAIASQGFLEADAGVHYEYAKFALQDSKNWHLLVNVWGRPVCTGVYALPALLGGRIAVRLTSLALALAIAWIAYSIAKHQGHRRPALALIFTLASPLVFLHSFSEMTELPFALLLVTGFLAYQRRWWWLMALAIGCSPASRPEGFGFLLMTLFALVVHRKFIWIPLLFLPLVAWNHFGWVLFGKQGPWWNWIRSQWPYQADSLYQSGPILQLLGAMPSVVGPIIFPAVWIGVYDNLKNWRLIREHRDRVERLIAILPLMILVGHSVLFWLGKMASSGEPRYLMIVAPFWGILAAQGWTWVFDRVQWRHEMRWAALACLLPIVANVFWRVVPFNYTNVDLQSQRIARWYKSSGLEKDYPLVTSSFHAFYGFADRSMAVGNGTRDWNKETIAKNEPGTLLVWDPVYSKANADAFRTVSLQELSQAGWVEIKDVPKDIGDFRVFHSREKAPATNSK